MKIFRITKFLIVALTTGGFIWLSYASQRWENMQVLAAHGYTKESAAKYDPSPVAFKIKQQPIKAYTKEQAWQYADLWDSPEYAQPVVLRRAK